MSDGGMLSVINRCNHSIDIWILVFGIISSPLNFTDRARPEQSPQLRLPDEHPTFDCNPPKKKIFDETNRQTVVRVC